MRGFMILTFLLFSEFLLQAQKPVGSWTDHLSYNNANQIALSTNEVFASTESAIIVYDRNYTEVRKLSKVTGLTESGISTIAYSNETSTLIVGYTSTNIDLVKGDVVYNLPDIKLKYLPGNKLITKIRSKGQYAYVACSFGIVVIDLVKKEVYDTWKPGSSQGIAEVFDLTFAGDYIYVTTENGVYYALTSIQGLSYFGNWTLLDKLPSPEAKYTSILAVNDKIYINRTEDKFTGDSVYVVDNSCTLFSFTEGIYNRSFDTFTSGFTITSSSGIRVFDQNGLMTKTINSYGWGQPDANHALVEGNLVWIADRKSGLVMGSGSNTFESIIPDGPLTNNVINISQGDGKVFLAGGGVNSGWNNLWRDGQIFSYENYTWYSEIRNDVKDVMRVVPEPGNNNHYYVSTWGGGLLEYRNNVLVNNYDETPPSPLNSIVQGQPFSRICGMAIDNDKNLWLTHSGVEGSIKMLKPDGTWVINPVTIDAPVIGDLIIARSGYKWVVLPRGYGLFVLNDNNTPEVFADDDYKKIIVRDTEGNIFSNIYSISEDLEGNIWVGTDAGPLIYFEPDNVFEEDPRALRIKVSRNDGTGQADYLLGTETITSIFVDGANRKWIGTESSGAYLLSSDGADELIHYNEENSPLPSNSIADILVEEKTGEVWFGTDKGTVSLRGEATTGKEDYNNIYAFPNPVREDFSGNVTITGLMQNTSVKITDISGNLVFETTSTGGQATWDLKTYNGNRVSTGVYVVFCSNEDGSVSGVTKVLVIR